MTTSRGAVSKVMHLTHIPDEKERKDSLSHCHICLKKVPLTKEHIPPEKAFNNCNRLWERLLISNNQKAAKRSTQIRGGLWVKTLCQSCNNEVCSPYAKEYVNFVKYLVESPKLFDQSGQARLISLKINTLFVAKEIVTMILAIEQLKFCIHHPELREFVLNKDHTIDSPFRIYAFLVPEVKEAGTVTRFHGRVPTYAPGFGFAGGEISWFPFGFIYASDIGSGYEPEKLTDITHWFKEKSDGNKTALIRLFCRVTGVDSIQCALGNRRVHPQIDHIAERYS